MKDYVVMIGAALGALLLGGWLPGGTYWLTPLASLALVALAFFGRQSPAILLAVVDGEWRTIQQLGWARRRTALGVLLLLALIAGLGQLQSEFGGQEVGIDATTNWRNAAAFRAALAPVRVTFLPQADGRDQQISGTLRIESAAASFALPASAAPGCARDLKAPLPAARVAWGWADVDLLPDLMITVRPDMVGGEAAQPRTFYVPLTDTGIHEQTPRMASSWNWVLRTSAGLALVGVVLNTLFKLLSNVVHRPRRNSTQHS